jgi:hypothetical protein
LTHALTPHVEKTRSFGPIGPTQFVRQTSGEMQVAAQGELAISICRDEACPEVAASGRRLDIPLEPIKRLSSPLLTFIVVELPCGIDQRGEPLHANPEPQGRYSSIGLL